MPYIITYILLIQQYISFLHFTDAKVHDADIIHNDIASLTQN
mgnify:CR=1 FL=1